MARRGSRAGSCFEVVGERERVEDLINLIFD